MENNNKFFLLIFFALFLCCKKNSCPDGYKCIDDSCVCPEGSFEAYGHCRPLETNEFYGVTNENCPCQDSIILHITQWDDDKIVYDKFRGTHRTLGAFPQPIRNDTIFPEYKDGSPFGTSCGNGTIFENWITLNGYGLISPQKDTITFIFTMAELTSNWENPDTCTIVFHK